MLFWSLKLKNILEEFLGHIRIGIAYHVAELWQFQLLFGVLEKLLYLAIEGLRYLLEGSIFGNGVRITLFRLFDHPLGSLLHFLIGFFRFLLTDFI